LGVTQYESLHPKLESQTRASWNPEPQQALVVEAAVARCPQRTKKSIASNMVQWLSQQYTTGTLSEFEARFKRQKIDRRWAYLRR
jgi:hypothetical protein